MSGGTRQGGQISRMQGRTGAPLRLDCCVPTRVVGAIPLDVAIRSPKSPKGWCGVPAGHPRNAHCDHLAPPRRTIRRWDGGARVNPSHRARFATVVTAVQSIAPPGAKTRRPVAGDSGDVGVTLADCGRARVDQVREPARNPPARFPRDEGAPASHPASPRPSEERPRPAGRVGPLSASARRPMRQGPLDCRATPKACHRVPAAGLNPCLFRWYSRDRRSHAVLGCGPENAT